MPPRTMSQIVGPDKALTDKQRRFVQEYIVDTNAKRAAERAGYSYSTSSGVNLMRNPVVARAIDSALAERAERLKIDADHVLAELGRIAFSNVMDLMARGEDGALDLDLDRLTRETGAAVSRLRVEYYADQSQGRRIRRVSVSLAEKTPALRELAKHLGMYREKVEVSLAEPEPIYIVTGVPRNRARLADPNRNQGPIRVIDPSEVEGRRRGLRAEAE